MIPPLSPTILQYSMQELICCIIFSIFLKQNVFKSVYSNYQIYINLHFLTHYQKLYNFNIYTMNNNQAPKIQNNKKGRQKLAQCHICMNIVTQYAECSGNRCKNAYCFNCIVEKFNKNFTPKDYVKGCWVCFQCGDACKCLLCTGIDRNRKKRNPKKQTVEQPSNTCTVSKYDEQKEQQDKEQPKDGEEKLKTRYDNRRLPKRKNTVFKYKKRRRTRNKNVNDFKDIIKNLKPEDKVLKIKKQDFISASQVSNFDESSELELISFSKQNQPQNSQQKVASQKSSEQKMQIQKDKIKEQPYYHEKESRILQYSSSLDYLGKQDNRFQVKVVEQKTKTIKKPQRKRQEIPLKKLSTIKSADSKKQISKSIEQIQVVGRTRRSQQIKQQVQNVPNTQQTTKRRIRRNLPQGNQQNNLANRNQEPSKRTHQTRRSIKIQQNKVQININEYPSTRQSRQLRKLFGTAYVRPSKRKPQQAQSQNEEGPIDQESRKISNEESQKLQSQNSGQGQGEIEDENNYFEEQDQLRGDREFFQEDLNQDSNRSPKKSKAMLMKQHYQEELQKNKDFQRNDQSSISNEMEQENAEEEANQKSQNINPEEANRTNSQNYENKTNENVSDRNDKAEKNQELNDVSEAKTITQNLRPKRNKDIRKSVHEDGVYKKGHHRKLHNPKPQQIQNVKKIDTNITNKWSKIPDQHLLDKRFFDRLCHQALFARQIFKKEISELIKRRQLIIQNKKLQSMAVVQQPLNNEINLC